MGSGNYYIPGCSKACGETVAFPLLLTHFCLPTFRHVSQHWFSFKHLPDAQPFGLFLQGFLFCFVFLPLKVNEAKPHSRMFSRPHLVTVRLQGLAVRLVTAYKTTQPRTRGSRGSHKSVSSIFSRPKPRLLVDRAACPGRSLFKRAFCPGKGGGASALPSPFSFPPRLSPRISSCSQLSAGGSGSPEEREPD